MTTLQQRWIAGILLVLGALGSANAYEIKTLVINGLVMTMEPGQEAAFPGYLALDADGIIQEVGRGTPPAAMKAVQTIDATGKFVLPGILSGHSHLWQSAFRGIASDQELWGWLELLHRTYGPFFGRGDFYAFTQHGALDYLRHGITTCYNWSTSLGQPEDLYLEQLDAEAASGERFVFGYGLNATLKLEDNRKNLQNFLAKSKALERNPLYLGPSISGQGAMRNPDLPRQEAVFMKEFKLGAQMHFLEDPNRQGIERASFPVLQSAGILTPGLMYAHYIHPDEMILKKSVEAGVRMIWNPLSNGRLASGLADIPRYLKAGVKIGMGLDGQASADLSDPFENMRMGLYATRMKYQSAKIMSPYDVLKLHTLGTAEVMGVENRVGSLKKGKYGDFLIVDPSSLDTGPVFDPYATLVFCCSIANLEGVYVGGELVSRRGELLKHDFGKLQADVARRVASIRAKQKESLRKKLP